VQRLVIQRHLFDCVPARPGGGEVDALPARTAPSAQVREPAEAIAEKKAVIRARHAEVATELGQGHAGESL
jgi:hypothetical protein